jgi:hypothetical protein
MSDDRDSTRAIAWFALILFTSGLLMPFIIWPLGRIATASDHGAFQLAALYAAVSELLALFLRIVGRRNPPGRIALLGSAIVITVVGFLIAAWIGRIA